MRDSRKAGARLEGASAIHARGARMSGRGLKRNRAYAFKGMMLYHIRFETFA
jgi:hypothetical protein